MKSRLIRSCQTSVAIAILAFTMAATRAEAATNAPVILGIDHAKVLTMGGEKVTMLGTGFTGATKVTFDGVKGKKLAVSNDGKLTVVTPAHSAGKVNVIVVTSSGKSARSAAAKVTYVRTALILNLDSKAVLQSDGSINVNFTAYCDPFDAQPQGFVSINVSQSSTGTVGLASIDASAIICDSTTHSYPINVLGFLASFSPGTAQSAIQGQLDGTVSGKSVDEVASHNVILSIS